MMVQPMWRATQFKRSADRSRRLCMRDACARVLKSKPTGHVVACFALVSLGPCVFAVSPRVLITHSLFSLEAGIDVIENKIRLNRMRTKNQHEKHPFHRHISLCETDWGPKIDLRQEHLILSRVESTPVAGNASLIVAGISPPG